jgi:hypothetical protein
MKPTIALFVADPKCSVQSANVMISSLDKYYHFKLFSKNKLEYNFFDNVDMIAIPGGLGDADSFNTLFKNNGNRVRDYIHNHGRYLGICMGAYWAGKHYMNVLEDVDAVQYLKRPNTDTRRPHAKNMPVNWQGDSTTMFWYDGCALVGDDTKFETVATYEANNDNMAIYQNRIGLIGCHPESQQFWYDGYSYLKGKYHGGSHHKLLLEFTNELMRR